MTFDQIDTAIRILAPGAKYVLRDGSPLSGEQLLLLSDGKTRGIRWDDASPQPTADQINATIV